MSYGASDAADDVRQMLVRQGVKFTQDEHTFQDEGFRIGNRDYEGPDNGGNATVVEALDQYLRRVNELIVAAQAASKAGNFTADHRDNLKRALKGLK